MSYSVFCPWCVGSLENGEACKFRRMLRQPGCTHDEYRQACPGVKPARSIDQFILTRVEDLCLPATGITRICPQKPWLTQGYAGMAAALPIVTAGWRFKSQGEERDLKKKRKLMGINLRLCKAVKPGERAGGF